MFTPYSYEKATPDNPHPGRFAPSYVKLLPTLFSAFGLALVGSVIWPILGYQIIAGKSLLDLPQSQPLLSPIVDDTIALASPEDNYPEVVSDIDYTKASTWFAMAPPEPNNGGFQVNPSSISNSGYFPPNLSQPTPTLEESDVALETFTVGVPSLGIDSATAIVNGEDLNQGLVHYPGSALPGHPGSVIIFGHSSLPSLYNPSNYKTIFATLPTISVGADIFITAEEVTYTYRVSKMYPVNPKDVWALRQDYSRKTLKLVTCVPPGTILKRLIVEANLVTNQ